MYISSTSVIAGADMNDKVEDPGSRTDELPAADIARTRGRHKNYARRLRHAIYPESTPVERIEFLGPTDRIAYEEALGLPFREGRIGQMLGPRWATYWFKVHARVP